MYGAAEPGPAGVGCRGKAGEGQEAIIVDNSFQTTDGAGR